MKNIRLTISFSILGIILVSMLSFVYHSKAQTSNDPNPYDDPSKSAEDVITMYNTNINNEMNAYISMMMTAPVPKPTDPPLGSNGTEGSSLDKGGNPLSVDQCFADPNNYSTFCVAANLLGANSDLCPAVISGQIQNPSDGMKTFCNFQPNSGAKPLNGYLNFVAALQKKSQNIFATSADQKNYSDYLETVMSLGISNPSAVKNNPNAGPVYQGQKALEISSRLTLIQNQIQIAKKALDESLSAYDQLGIAWPMHLKYVDVYNALVQYRDGLVNLRHQAELLPSKFIDLTTTACV